MRRRTYRAHGRINGSLCRALAPLPPGTLCTFPLMSFYTISHPNGNVNILAYQSSPSTIEVILTQTEEEVPRPEDVADRSVYLRTLGP